MASFRGLRPLWYPIRAREDSASRAGRELARPALYATKQRRLRPWLADATRVPLFVQMQKAPGGELESLAVGVVVELSAWRAPCASSPRGLGKRVPPACGG